MTSVTDFVDWLKTEGFEIKQHQEIEAPQTMAQANICTSLEHKSMGWAHVSQYNRGESVRVECVLHPQLLGERMVFRDLEPAKVRLVVIRSRYDMAPHRVWSEKPKRKRRDGW